MSEEEAVARAAPAARSLRWLIYRAIALCFLLAGTLHLYEALTQARDEAGRHWAFVGINLTFAILFATERRWTLVPFALLSVQQIGSHGAKALEVWSEQGVLSPRDVSVVLFMPAVIAFLGWDVWSRLPRIAGRRR